MGHDTRRRLLAYFEWTWDCARSASPFLFAHIKFPPIIMDGVLDSFDQNHPADALRSIYARHLYVVLE